MESSERELSSKAQTKNLINYPDYFYSSALFPLFLILTETFFPLFNSFFSVSANINLKNAKCKQIGYNFEAFTINKPKQGGINK